MPLRTALFIAFVSVFFLLFTGIAPARDESFAHDVTQEHPLPTEQRDFASTYKRTEKKIAEGVYVIRHPEAPDQFPQGNTTVIIGSKSVFVIDSCYLPSTARKDIAQIRKWTNKPVRYLLNTHWHYDHTLGNEAYAAAFPGLTIISQRRTKALIEGYTPYWFSNYPHRGSKIREMLKSGKDESGAALTDEDKKALETELAGREAVEAEFKKTKTVPPNKVFDDKMAIDLGGRKVQLLYYGHGNTVGDAMAYLAKEKILITGDLVDHPVPYLGGGFPSDQIETLEKMSKLDFKQLVPGHGEVLHSKEFVLKMIEFIRLIVNRVDKMVYTLERRSTALDAVQAAMEKFPDIPKWRKYFAGDDPDNVSFFDSFTFPGLVKAAFSDSWRR